MPIELDHTLVPSHHQLASAKLLAEFDAILAGLRAAGIAFRSSVRGPMDMQVNTDDGGNRVYWNEPDGHQWEMLTIRCARQGA